MEFIITRTSDYGGDLKEAPIEGAYQKDIIETFKFIDDGRPISKYWFEEGINHRRENGFVMRDEPKTVWAIQINSLEELVKLVDECEHEIIIGRHTYANEYFDLEIYDDWRE